MSQIFNLRTNIAIKVLNKTTASAVLLAKCTLLYAY